MKEGCTMCRCIYGRKEGVYSNILIECDQFTCVLHPCAHTMILFIISAITSHVSFFWHDAGHCWLSFAIVPGGQVKYKALKVAYFKEAGVDKLFDDWTSSMAYKETLHRHVSSSDWTCSLLIHFASLLQNTVPCVYSSRSMQRL